jgi:hypothetical protein
VEGKGAMEGSHGGEPWVVAWLTEPVSAPTWSVGPDGYHFFLAFPVTRSVFLALLYYGRC